jgi:hypothetical protein
MEVSGFVTGASVRVTGARVFLTVPTVCAATDVIGRRIGATGIGRPRSVRKPMPRLGFGGGVGRPSACATALPATTNPNRRPATISERRSRPTIRGSIDLTLPANAHIRTTIPEATQKSERTITHRR